MTINIIDHDEASRHLGEAIESVQQARVILRNTNASHEIAYSLIHAEDSLHQATAIIFGAIKSQILTDEESKPT